jgi:hypothetical protein
MHSITDVVKETHPEMQICFLDFINDDQKLNDEIDLWKSNNDPVLLYCLDNFKITPTRLKPLDHVLKNSISPHPASTTTRDISPTLITLQDSLVASTTPR